MAIFAAHCASEFRRSNAALERARVYRVGFVWPALIFGPLWLLAQRLWRPLALWIVAAALVGVAIAYGLLDSGAAFPLYGLAALYLAIEGRGARGGGADSAAASRSPTSSARPTPPAPNTRFSPAPPMRTTAAAAAAAVFAHGANAGAPHGVIGLFPEAGG